VKKLSIPVLIALAGAGILLVGGAQAHPTAATAAAKAKLQVHSGKLGRFLVDSRGMTLYLFEKDKGGKSACSGACAQNWPPLLTKGAPKAGPSAKASLLGTIKRADGTTQVTYNKHPLYTFAGDQGKRGATKGEGLDAFGAKWYVVAAKGTEKTGGY
jgi:predicted lipoprotein with Yx(FWY)xxD motif